jgi:tetratricopeptide (TPR) repeat protein
MQSIEAQMQPFTKQPVYRYLVQAVTAATVILAIFSIIKLLPTSEKDSSATRGITAAPTITQECKNAIELYNTATAAPDLQVKESSLKGALAANCTDTKALARIHNSLADNCVLQNRLDEALAGYKKATELDPQHYPAFRSMGDLYNKQGRKQEAAAQYGKALALLEAIAARGEPVSLQIAQLKTEISKLK